MNEYNAEIIQSVVAKFMFVALAVDILTSKWNTFAAYGHTYAMDCYEKVVGIYEID